MVRNRTGAQIKIKKVSTRTRNLTLEYPEGRIIEPDGTMEVLVSIETGCPPKVPTYTKIKIAAVINDKFAYIDQEIQLHPPPRKLTEKINLE